MTDNEIQQVLKDIFVLTNSMDKEHLIKLFQTLTGEDKVGLVFEPTMRKTVKKALKDYICMGHLWTQITYKQMKQMYTIMGDYGHYPVCKLCGKPIHINGQTVRNSVTKRNNKEFTWDHIFPKSLGGANDLSNMQPTHKICNNHKGNTLPEEHVHYEINIVINMCFDDCANKVVRNKNRNIKKVNPILRKQDSWCHKHRKCHFGKGCRG